MAKLTLSDLQKMNDQELLELLGFSERVDKFKEQLSETAKLPPKQKTFVEERIQRMLTPNIYGDELEWAIQDAKRKDQTGKEAMADCCCRSVLD